MAGPARLSAGYQPNKGTLECNDGVLTGGPVFCSSAPPPVGGNFFNCWTGDPHFVCRNGKRTDPLVPGTHWVFKQSCPGSPNFMWVQGLFGPRRPSCTLGTAFGGNFLGMNVLTIRANNNPPWIVKWNDQPLQNSWSGSGNSWKYDLAGTELTVSWNNNHLQAGLSYGVTYRAQRSYWNRENNIRVSGYYYTDYYMQNRFWSSTCVGAALKGEAVELHHGYNPRVDNRFVSSAFDMFQQSKSNIENRLNTLTSMASLLDTDDDMWGEDNVYLNMTMDDDLGGAPDDKLCTGKPLEEAKEKCAVLKKEETEEEKEEIEEDEEAKEQQDATYVACISDVCQTANGDFGEAAKETEEESEMQAALKHKKAFRVAAADGDCKTGWTPTDSNDNFLSDEEKSRADKKKQGCTTACKVCRPAHRRYLIGPLALHNETQAACQNQQLAMPKSDGDKTRLSILQKKFCSAEKAWLGANYKDDAWKWADGSVVEGTGGITGKAGDYLCMDKEDGSYLNCDHRPDVKHDALCETIFY